MGKYLGDVASDVYGVTTTGTQSLLPRSKFQFSVIMTLVDASGTHKSFPLSRISSIDQPSYSARVSTLNQYNKKRLVQTGIDYSPIQLVAYDTRDAYIENFLKSYSQYYYGNTMVVDTPGIFKNDTINNTFNQRSGFSGTGMKPTSYEKYFINNMKIIRTSSEDDITVTTMYNLMITSIQLDTLNYSDSTPVQYTIGLNYEGFDIKSGNKTESFFASELEQLNSLL